MRLWPYRDIRQTQGFYAGEEVRLERGGELAEAVRSCRTRAFLHSLHEAAPRPSALPRSRGTRPAGAPDRPAGVVLAASRRRSISGAFPSLAALAAPRVPVAWEESLGRAVMTTWPRPTRCCANPSGQRALDAIVARLAAAAPPSPYTFRVRVVERPVTSMRSPRRAATSWSSAGCSSGRARPRSWRGSSPTRSSTSCTGTPRAR